MQKFKAPDYFIKAREETSELTSFIKDITGKTIQELAKGTEAEKMMHSLQLASEASEEQKRITKACLNYLDYCWERFAYEKGFLKDYDEMDYDAETKEITVK